MMGRNTRRHRGCRFSFLTATGTLRIASTLHSELLHRGICGLIERRNCLQMALTTIG
jgi:hypothetical protein